MNKYATWITTAAALLLSSACSTLTTSKNVGSVADATVTDLRLCFRSGAIPPPGQEVQIMRRELVGSGKPPANYLARQVGTARITAAASDSCVAAVMVDGKARPNDQVQWPAPDVQN